MARSPWVSGLVRQNARVLSIAMRKSILRNPHERADRTRDYPPQAARPAPAPRYASARASYPVFLAFHDTLRLQIGWAWRGLVDAFRWDIVVGLMTRNVCRCPLFFARLLVDRVYAAMPRSARMRSSLSCSTASPCCRSMSLTFSCIRCRAGKREGMGRAAHLWHGRRTGSIGVSVGSIVFCGCCLSSACPCISMCVVFLYFSLTHPAPLPPHTHRKFRAVSGCWRLYISFVQASWCSLIAKRTFTLRHGLAYPYAGMSSTTSPNAYIAFLNSLATSAYRAVMVATCVFVSFALGYVPIVGGAVETVFFCWVDA